MCGSDHEALIWVESWSVLGLSADDRDQIREHIWSAHVAYLKSGDYIEETLPDALIEKLGLNKTNPFAHVEPMNQAFDGIARVLFNAGLLTTNVLRKDIPILIWDSAIAGGWFPRASASRIGDFVEQFGHYWYCTGHEQGWRGNLFRAETEDWTRTLSQQSSQSKSPPLTMSIPSPSTPDATRLCDCPSGHLSKADDDLFKIIGIDSFLTLTNQQIAKKFKKPIRTAFPDSGTESIRARLNRIRKGRGLPQSRQNAKPVSP